MSYGKITTAISLITFILAVFFLISRGLNLSVEFTGGTMMEVAYSQPVEISRVRNSLNTLGYPQATVQNFGNNNIYVCINLL